MRKLLLMIITILALSGCSTLINSAVALNSYADLERDYAAAHNAVLSSCKNMTFQDCENLKLHVATIDNLVKAIGRIKNGELADVDNIRSYYYFGITAWGEIRELLDGKINDPIKARLLLEYDKDILRLSISVGGLLNAGGMDQVALLNSLIQLAGLAAKTAALF